MILNEYEMIEQLKELEEVTKIERTRAAKTTKLSYANRIAQKRGFDSDFEYRNWWAQQRGFANRAEYENWRVQQRGFTNNTEYLQNLRFKKGVGTGLSMDKSINSASYLGIYIAERLLPNLFQDPVMMPHGTCGYDAICKNNYKIDVKSSVLSKANIWLFNINRNKIADAFLCIAFDNRTNLEVQHIWLISGNSIVRNRVFNELKVLGIYNTEGSRASVAKYELSDKLEHANNVCVLFKNGVLK